MWWTIDLIDKTFLAKYNKNYKLNLTTIENHTKYAWAVPLLNKSSNTTTQALETFFEKKKNTKQNVVR